jgi:hypothetical protein
LPVDAYGLPPEAWELPSRPGERIVDQRELAIWVHGTTHQAADRGQQDVELGLTSTLTQGRFYVGTGVRASRTNSQPLGTGRYSQTAASAVVGGGLQGRLWMARLEARVGPTLVEGNDFDVNRTTLMWHADGAALAGVQWGATQVGVEVAATPWPSKFRTFDGSSHVTAPTARVGFFASWRPWARLF